jgi:hypothetical protein
MVEKIFKMVNKIGTVHHLRRSARMRKYKHRRYTK